MQPNETLSLRCILDECSSNKTSNLNSTIPLWDRLKRKISSYCIRSISELQQEVFQMKNAENFLVRNETKFFPFSQVNITNEDLNMLLNANNRHMTLCLNWKASVSDNGKFLRNAYGQHCVQIDNLFES